MARKKAPEATAPKPKPSERREFFLARCDACPWQVRKDSEEAAAGALAAHLDEFHPGAEVGTEPEQVPAQVVEVKVEKAVAVAE